MGFLKFVTVSSTNCLNLVWHGKTKCLNSSCDYPTCTCKSLLHLFTYKNGRIVKLREGQYPWINIIKPTCFWIINSEVCFEQIDFLTILYRDMSWMWNKKKESKLWIIELRCVYLWREPILNSSVASSSKFPSETKWWLFTELYQTAVHYF